MQSTKSTLMPRVLLTSMLFALSTWNDCAAATGDQVDLTSTIVARETAALETFKNHNKTLLKQLCLPGFYEITSDGSVNTLGDELLELDDYVLGRYKMEDVVVTLLPNDVALIRYKITAAYAYKGKLLPVYPMLATAVWIKVGAVWKAATYQEVRLPEKS
jgi:hypothetical protein